MWNFNYCAYIRVYWRPGFQVHEDGIKSKNFPNYPKILGENKINLKY